MKMDLARTIVAIGSGIAPARRAIVRLSGNSTREILSHLLASEAGANRSIDDFLSPTNQAGESRYRGARHIRSECRFGPSPRCIPADVYYWPNTRSYTGEPCAEVHTVGSLPIVESLIEHIVSLGARPADRGEFTLRSFLAGKIDLTQAEAVLGVIEADDEAELARALGQLGGNISEPVRALRDQLMELTAHLEAGLDFVEEDIEFISAEVLCHDLTQINATLKQISDRLASRGSRSRVAEIVLVGLPNAGKSSLFNAIVGSERAIVSELAGTTRDAVTTQVQIGNLQVELVDTAGIEELHEASPRAIAQQVLQSKLSAADTILFCVDLSRNCDAQWVTEQRNVLSAYAPVLLVGTKHDSALLHRVTPVDITISQTDPDSISRLGSLIEQTLAESTVDLRSNAMHHTMIRCKESIDLARAAIGRALEHAGLQLGEELVASELRIALDDLSAVIGEVHTEDILGQIFSRFCIGK